MMYISKQVKNLGMVAAIGAASIMSSVTVNAATLQFTEGDQVFDSAVTTNFSLTLTADGLLANSYGGGIGITFDNTVVSITAATIDPVWNLSTNKTVDNVAGTIELFVSALFFGPSPINTASQGIATIDFTVVGDGAFDFGLYSLGAIGDWGYDLTSYCLTKDSGATCLDSNTNPSGRELLTLASSNLTVSSVPVPAAVWLFGSGMIGLLAVARRRAV